MKKYVLPISVALVLAGGLFVGGYAATDALYADAYAEGVESAQPAPALPDPVADPVATGSLVWRLWKGGALIPALLVAAFAVLVALSRKVKWLGEGKRAVWTAAGLAGLAMLAEPASRGETPNLAMIVAALGSMAALILSPQKKEQAWLYDTLKAVPIEWSECPSCKGAQGS